MERLERSQKAPLLTKEGWHPLRMTGWFFLSQVGSSLSCQPNLLFMNSASDIVCPQIVAAREAAKIELPSNRTADDHHRTANQRDHKILFRFLRKEIAIRRPDGILKAPCLQRRFSQSRYQTLTNLWRMFEPGSQRTTPSAKRRHPSFVRRGAFSHIIRLRSICGGR
jgi:hypothetical protein